MADTKPEKSELDELRLQLDLLERDNQRLRERLEPVLGADNPCFNPTLFRQILATRIMLLTMPAFLMLLIPMIVALSRPTIPRWYLGNLPVIDLAGHASGFTGFGVGLISLGGLSVGAIAIGGGAIGILAVGGGAIGFVAIGGGAVGLIAVGGSAFGLIAVGGGVAGYYALGQQAWGKHVLCLKRQDPQAIEFFTKYMPSLKRALTTPMPVIPINKADNT